MDKRIRIICQDNGKYAIYSGSPINDFLFTNLKREKVINYVIDKITSEIKRNLERDLEGIKSIELNPRMEDYLYHNTEGYRLISETTFNKLIKIYGIPKINKIGHVLGEAQR